MKVFVYGTLKQGHYNHAVMERSGGVYIRDTSTESTNYTMYDLGAFPAVVLGGSTRIKGELYEVDDLRELDILEGYPSFYTRQTIDLVSGEEALIYTLNRFDIYDKVHTGEWVKK